ncbi:MAG: helix-turn-helix transcriptional regulator [Sandaracinaceae bacterium]|nr:helix-turn-helix transcriptional regulator [Sandaracinaceae bacterium]
MQAELARALEAGGVEPARLAEPAALDAPFSPREREVLRLLLAHKRPKTIAAQLGISPSTVRNHLKSMFAKVGVASQEDLLEVVLASGDRVDG